MTVVLTADALKKLASGFGVNSIEYNAIIEAASQSDFLAGELNEFGAAGQWQFKRRVAGSGVSTGSRDKVISFDPSWSESPNVFATTLAHELGHALLPGGMGGSLALNPDVSRRWTSSTARTARSRSSLTSTSTRAIQSTTLLPMAHKQRCFSASMVK